MAGYLTPPSDITQEDDDGTHHERLAARLAAGGGTSHGLRVEKPPWTQLSAPVLAATDIEKNLDSLTTDEIRINVPILSKVSVFQF